MWRTALTGQWLGALSSVSDPPRHTRLPPTSPVSNSGLGAHGKTEHSGRVGHEEQGTGK